VVESRDVVDSELVVVEPGTEVVEDEMAVVVNGAVVVISISGGSVTPPQGFPVGVHRN